jgi:hypothetical protein
VAPFFQKLVRLPWQTETVKNEPQIRRCSIILKICESAVKVLEPESYEKSVFIH